MKLYSGHYWTKHLCKISIKKTLKMRQISETSYQMVYCDTDSEATCRNQL